MTDKLGSVIVWVLFLVACRIFVRPAMPMLLTLIGAVFGLMLIIHLMEGPPTAHP